MEASNRMSETVKGFTEICRTDPKVECFEESRPKPANGAVHLETHHDSQANMASLDLFPMCAIMPYSRIFKIPLLQLDGILSDFTLYGMAKYLS